MRQAIKPSTLFAAMAVVLIVSLAALYLMGLLTIDKTREVVRRQEQLDLLQQTFTTLLDAETGQRGYLLSGDEAYLIPYSNAVKTINGELDALDERARNNVLSPTQVTELRHLTRQKLDELHQTVELRRRDGAEAAMRVVQSDVGNKLMNAIRTLTGAMEDHERSGLRRAHEAATRYTLLRTVGFGALVLLNLLFLGWAHGRVVQEMKRQKETATELRRQRDLTRVTLSSIGDAVIVTDGSAQITFMNPVAEALTGWKLDEAQRQPLTNVFRIINEQSRQSVENPVDKVLRLGAIVGLANHTLLVRRDGSEVPIDDSGAPIRDVEGPVHGVVLVFRDFSEYKANERELSRAKSEAEAASRAKDQFMAALSHELRTPLTPVLATLTNWEASEGLPAEYQSQVTMLRRNVELEARLIDDLLDLTRIAKGKIQLNTEVVDIHDLLRSVRGICQSEINAKQIRAQMHLEAPRHFVNADSARMQQVFWNILRNAAKFTAEGGHVNIRTSNDADGRVRVTIVDDGIGMSQETLDRLFRPFEQGTGDITKRFGGLGLGMAISKALLDVQGGTIEAQSQGSALGASFSVTMPSVPAPKPSSKAPAIARPADARALRILLVEDHADTARAMGRLLGGMNHQVQLASTVAAASQLVDSQSFDLIISDIGLPDGTGIDFIRRVRQTSQVPAIALTGFGMEDDVNKCREAGFTVHLTKPVNFQKLEMVVQQVAVNTA